MVRPRRAGADGQDRDRRATGRRPSGAPSRACSPDLPELEHIVIDGGSQRRHRRDPARATARASTIGRASPIAASAMPSTRAWRAPRATDRAGQRRRLAGARPDRDRGRGARAQRRGFRLRRSALPRCRRPRAASASGAMRTMPASSAAACPTSTIRRCWPGARSTSGSAASIPQYRIAMDYDWLLRAHRAGFRGVYEPRLVGHMTLAGASDRRYREAFAEVRQDRDPPRPAASRGLGALRYCACSRAAAARALERLLPAALHEGLRRRVNRHFTPEGLMAGSLRARRSPPATPVLRPRAAEAACRAGRAVARSRCRSRCRSISTPACCCSASSR